MPLLLTESDAARCLDMASLIPLMREVLGRFSRGEVVQPVRTNLAIKPAGGFYGVMPAHVRGGSVVRGEKREGPGERGEVRGEGEGDGGVFGLKSVSFFPGNAERGLPTHLATILLLDGSTGALIAILDGRLITEMRTAAVSAVSVDLLARKDARHLAILGSGVQARSHLAAVALVRRIESVRVWSRTRRNAERFAGEMAHAAPCPIAVEASAREAVDGADIVVTVTSATEPILEAGWLARGSHLCVVGSSHPRMREVDSETVIQSGVFVDSRAAAAVEAGDLLIPAAEGRWSLDRVRGELGDVVNGLVSRSSDKEITLFKSLGLAVEDIASAELAVRRATERNVGTELAP